MKIACGKLKQSQIPKATNLGNPHESQIKLIIASLNRSMVRHLLWSCKCKTFIKFLCLISIYSILDANAVVCIFFWNRHKETVYCLMKKVSWIK
jgi:hypothetical protein